MTVFIPIVPVAWSRPRANFKTRAVFNSPRLRAYQSALRRELRRALGSAQPFLGDVMVCLRFFMPMPKRKVRERPGVKPDLSNLIKAVEDAANGILWRDDAQVVELVTVKAYDWQAKRVGIEILVEEITP